MLFFQIGLCIFLLFEGLLSQIAFTPLFNYSSNLLAQDIQAQGETLMISSTIDVWVSSNGLTQLNQIKLPVNVLFIRAIAASGKDAKGFIATDSSQVLVIDLGSRGIIFTVSYFHPYFKDFAITQLLWVETAEGSELLIAISDMSEDLLFLHPLGLSPQVWLTTGNKPLKEIAASPRVLIAMPEQGSSLIQIDLGKKQTFGETTSLSSPGYALYKIVYYELFPKADLFFAATSDGNMTTGIFLFDGASNALTKLADFGTWIERPEFFKYLRGTHFMVIGGGSNVAFLNLVTREISPLVLKGRQAFWTQIGNSQMISSFSIQRMGIVTGEITGNVACFLGCSKCTKAMSNSSCQQCMAGFTLTSQGGCAPTCPLDKVYQLESGQCVDPSSNSNFYYMTNITVGNGITSCSKTAPHKLACLKCSVGFKISKGGCVAQDQCPESTVKINNDSCLPCNAACYECYDKEVYTCILCKAGFNFDKRECKSNCAKGYFYNSYQGECSQCYIGCDRCLAEDELKCIECVNGMYLNGGFCYSICPVGFIPNDKTKTCVPCKDPDCAPCTGPKVAFKGKCYDSCPPNTGSFDNTTCYPCYDFRCDYLQLFKNYVVDAVTGNPVDGKDSKRRKNRKEFTAGVVITSILFAMIGGAGIVFCIIRYCEWRKEQRGSLAGENKDRTYADLFKHAQQPPLEELASTTGNR